MSRHSLFIILLLISAANMSMDFADVSGLLENEDFRLLEENRRRGPALTSSADTPLYWESFNEWQCFSADEIDLRMSENEFEHNEVMFVPTLATWFQSHLYEFEVSSELVGGSGLEILEEWRGLLESESSICVMAAFLQSLGSERSLWILHSLKTQKGYWRASELEQ